MRLLAAAIFAPKNQLHLEGRTIKTIDLKQYGYLGTETIPEGMLVGRITEVQRNQYTVMTEQGEMLAVLRGSFLYHAKERSDFPCVGDFVLLRPSSSGVSRIEKLLSRHSKFSRADFSGHAVAYVKMIKEQVVATNFDYVFILTSLNWDFKVSRVLRYLTQARQSGGEPVVILTKADLTTDYSAYLAQVQQAEPDVKIHAISSHTGEGLAALDSYLQPGKTIVFLGMSGVGKSSLLNALMKQEVMGVKTIREEDSRGRHMTTHRQLFMLPSGAMVIDTPGMRELGLYGADEGINEGFADLAELFAECCFSDCRHNNEPGCAVLAALQDGTLPKERWERYLAQKRENAFVDHKSAHIREQSARLKAMAKQSKKKGGNH
ncbi:MAG: ribosome small subunit-dependent GTPase A [Clostridiales bacterium]|nr:ribosome small subunit-dependent GTPase A [Clostridiales bacterium]